MSTKAASLADMSCGYPEYEKVFEEPLFSNLNKKSLLRQYKPSQVDYGNEVKRRAYFILEEWKQQASKDGESQAKPPLRGAKMPKPTSWLIEMCKKWLSQYKLKISTSETGHLSTKHQRGTSLYYLKELKKRMS